MPNCYEEETRRELLEQLDIIAGELPGFNSVLEVYFDLSTDSLPSCSILKLQNIIDYFDGVTV